MSKLESVKGIRKVELANPRTRKELGEELN